MDIKIHPEILVFICQQAIDKNILDFDNPETFQAIQFSKLNMNRIICE